MDEKVLSEPYADNDAKLIAIVEEFRRNMQSDMDEVREDNKLLDVSGMMVRQSLQAVLVKLAASPVLAGKLGDFRGLEFEHPNLRRGRIGVTLSGGIVTVKIRAGSFTKKFTEEDED